MTTHRSLSGNPNGVQEGYTTKTELIENSGTHDRCLCNQKTILHFFPFVHPFFSFRIYLFYIWVVYLHIYALGACRVQMWALDPPELEFRMAVNHHMSLLQEQMLLAAEPSLQPQFCTF